MGKIRFWRVLVLCGAIGAVAVVVPALTQPDLLGRWCNDGSLWRVCYREWLIPIAGFTAALAAVALIAYERARTKDAERRRRRAPRMRVASELASLAQGNINIATDLDLYKQTNGVNGRLWSELPLPSFAGSAREMEDMPEVQSLLRFAQGIANTNREISWLRDDDILDEEELRAWIAYQAAKAALDAIKWHDQLADAIRRRVPWSPFVISEEQKARLLQIIDETKHMDPGASSPTADN